MAVEAKVRIGAKDNTGKAFSSLKRRLTSVKSAMGGMAAKMALLVGTAGLGLLLSGTLKNVDATAKFADKIGISTEALSELHHAAELTGVSNKDLNMGLQRMTRRVAEAANGTGAASKALKELGIDAKELAALAPDQQFSKIAESMNEVGSRSDQVRLAFSVFDSGGVGLLNTMDAGAAGIRAMQEEAVQLGISISRVDAAKIEAANDAMSKTGGVLTGFGNNLTTALSPFLESASNWLVDIAKKSGGFKSQIESAMKFAAKAVGVFRDGLRGIQVVFKSLQLAAAALGLGFLSVLKGLDSGLTVFLNAYGMGVRKTLSPILGLAAKFSDSAAEAKKSLNSMTSFTPSANISLWGDVAAASVLNLKDELHETLMQKLPSDGVSEAFNSIRSEAEAAAVAVAESKKKMIGSDVDPKEAAASPAETDQLQSQIDAMRLSFLSQSELEMKNYEEKLAANDDFLVKKLESDVEHKLLKEQIEAEHQAKLTGFEEAASKKRMDIAAKEQRQKMAATQGFFSNITSAMAGGSKRMFEVAKASSIANALIKGYEAVQSAYAAGNLVGGPIVGGAFAVAAGLATARNVANIRKQKFGGGGAISVGASSVPSASGGDSGSSPALPQSQSTAQEQKPQTVVQFLGDWSGVSKDSIDQVMDGIAEKINDGGAVLFGPGSEQAQALKS